MLRTLAGVTLLLTGADHWTTYVCLRMPVAGWEIVEANPIADWLFEATGLVGGLAIDSAITLAAVGFLLVTQHFAERMKLGALAFIATTTGYAVVNNLGAMQSIGLSPLGLS